MAAKAHLSSEKSHNDIVVRKVNQKDERKIRGRGGFAWESAGTRPLDSLGDEREKLVVQGAGVGLNAALLR